MKALENPKFQIRLAADEDFEIIFSIWLQGIGNSFDDTEIGREILKQRFSRNFNQREGIFNFWVAVDDQAQILGWQSLIRVSNNPFRQDKEAESSTYVSKYNRYDGVGEKLLDFVVKEAEKSQLEHLVGYVATGNRAAKKIIEKTGWQIVGEMPGSKKGSNKIAKYFIVRPV